MTMTRMWLIFFLALVMIAPAVGCDDPTDGDTDADSDSDADTDTDADVDADADSDADGDTDADSDGDADTDGDTDTDSDGDTDGDMDQDGETDGGDADVMDQFPLRVPESRQLECDDGQVTLMDADMVCHIVYGDLDFEIYVQATPAQCGQSWMADYSFDTVGYIRQGDAVGALTAEFDFGGRHANEFLTFWHEGVTYTIHQASLGWGFRACAPPNCLLVCAGNEPCSWNTDVTVDGCVRHEKEGPPPHPITCVRVAADGTVPPLLDPWTGHDGNDPLLPCGGDMTVYD